jgi:gluconokinase
MASGTGIFDIRRCGWDKELSAYLKINPAALPELTTSDQQELVMLPKWRKRWPRLQAAGWFPPVADGAANNIGSGCTDATKAALMVGTSGAMRIVCKGDLPKKIPSGLWCYRVDRERVIVGGALSDGGGLYDWLKRNLRIDLSNAVIEKQMARRGANAHGLTVLPFLAGERSTGYNEKATGAILGLTMAHDATDILQSGLESVAYRFADMLEQLESVFPAVDIVVSGGALNASPVWTQIIANVLGRDIAISNQPEASLRGAVLLALATTGKIELTDTVSAVKNRRVLFHPDCHEVYRRARIRQTNLIK